MSKEAAELSITITAKEESRLGIDVLVRFFDDNSTDLLPGGRYYPATNDSGTGWDDSDGKAYIVARFAQEWRSRQVLPTPTPIPTLGEVQFVMKSEDIETKLTEIAQVEMKSQD